MKLLFAFHPSPDPPVAITPKAAFRLLGLSRYLELPVLTRLLSSVGRIQASVLVTSVVPADSVAGPAFQGFSAEARTLHGFLETLPPEDPPPEPLKALRRIARMCDVMAPKGASAGIRVSLDPEPEASAEDDVADGSAALRSAIENGIRWETFEGWEAFAAAADKRALARRDDARRRKEEVQALESEGVAFLEWYEGNAKKFLDEMKSRAARRDATAAGLLALAGHKAPIPEFIEALKERKAPAPKPPPTPGASG